MIHTLAPLPGVFMFEEPAPLPDGLQAYCVRCKSNHTMTHAQLVTTRSGRQAARGKCQVCGTTMMKFLPAQ